MTEWSINVSVSALQWHCIDDSGCKWAPGHLSCVTDQTLAKRCLYLYTASDTSGLLGIDFKLHRLQCGNCCGTCQCAVRFNRESWYICFLRVKAPVTSGLVVFLASHRRQADRVRVRQAAARDVHIDLQSQFWSGRHSGSTIFLLNFWSFLYVRCTCTLKRLCHLP